MKRFVRERGSERVREIVALDEYLATAKIAFAEWYAALTRRKREGDLSATDYSLACRNFEEDWHSYVRVETRDEVLTLARDLIKRRPLRGFDAIHLAAALTLRRMLGSEIRFVASDARLLDAAKSERLKVVEIPG